MLVFYVVLTLTIVVALFAVAMREQKRQTKKSAANHIIDAIATSRQLVVNTVLTGSRDEQAIVSYFVPAYHRWFQNARRTLPPHLEPPDRRTVEGWTRPLATDDWQRCKDLLLRQINDLQDMLPRYDDRKQAAPFLASESNRR